MSEEKNFSIELVGHVTSIKSSRLGCDYDATISVESSEGALFGDNAIMLQRIKPEYAKHMIGSTVSVVINIENEVTETCL